MNTIKWTYEAILKEALKYKTRWGFQNGSPAAHSAARRRGILDQVCAHMGPPIKNEAWTVEELQIEALKYTSRIEFKKKSSHAYKVARRMGILNRICSHMVPTHIYWTDEILQLEALKYNTRIEFIQKSKKAYEAASHRGILDIICSHMYFVRIQWTDEMLREEALKYKTYREFNEKSHSAYESARIRGILEKICFHMGPRRGMTSSDERYLLDLIHKIYPNAKSIRDLRVHIEGKPHIKGFDIDIYIPELKKGIEYDGIYWHSFEGLKRTKPLWPERDLRDYHKLKDNWFAGKGVQLLHIKEEDWIVDKEDCIKRCLVFLAS